MKQYLNELTSSYKMVRMEIIGQSLEGREIPALYFSSDKTFGSQRTVKPLCWFLPTAWG